MQERSNRTKDFFIDIMHKFKKRNVDKRAKNIME